MSMFRPLRELNPAQRSTVLASFLGWTLDAFDFFILVFVIKDIAHDFGTEIEAITYAITLTLMMRPVGAFVFGLIADRFGRRPTLMIDVVFYSVLELLTAFAPSRLRSRPSWFCGHSTASPWAGSGVWAPH
ncbi:MAG: transporter, family, lactate transporter [Rhodospirillaceae bacterium]|nr:transporter, family, lactate transporter [Rhodospirillaceae bacterium]